MIRTLSGLLALVLCCTTGCSNGTTTVSGRVTLDGQALTTGTVSFNPQEAAPAAIGQIDSSGNYRLSVGTSANVSPGTYQVTIVATELVPPTPTDPSPLPKTLTPAHYNDPQNPDMVREVKAGSNRFDFELKSKP